MVVFIKDNIRQRRHFLQMRRNGLFFTLRHANRRNAHFITRFQFVLGFNAFFIHPHFAFTQNAINHTFRHTLKLGAQKVVDALPCFVGSNGNCFYGWSLCFHGGRF
ncbi:hypothetical protein SDC9_184455 [bioreactor metagenome]|uniref:Uncharacterized protein n=1 Tax=bioreactor metagenome TaxID=1076179 RepID=A0A645HNB7_9ZZZZ